jgi:acetyl-CoA acetyltransferase
VTEVAVLGVGLHPFGKFPDKTLTEMIREAVQAALDDAGVSWPEVQAVAAGSSHFSGGMGWGLSGNEIATDMGSSGGPVYNLSAACATGASAFNVGHMLVASGQYDIVLVAAGEKMPRGFIARPPGAAADASDVEFLRWICVGCPNTAYWALGARRRMIEFGTTAEDLAMVAAKARRAGALNEKARFRQAAGHDEILGSPMVSDPLRLLEICAVSDGAAAAVLCSAAVAAGRGRTPVWVAGTSAATSRLGDVELAIPELSAAAAPLQRDHADVTSRAVAVALERAGLEPQDIGVIELQDNSVWQELEFPELWGFWEPGQSEWMVRRGDTSIGGSRPVNPSGGFLSFGEATTVMGLFQVYELVRQLRGEAGSRQAGSPATALGQTRGLGGNGAAVVLKR